MPLKPTTSGLPSALKSPTPNAGTVAPHPTLVSYSVRATLIVGLVMLRNSGFEVPPPGAGLDTVTEAVFAVAMFVVGTEAVSWELLTKVVTSAMPFQFTVAPETNWVPFTVSVNPGPPGTTAEGTSGWLTNGTGFPASASVLAIIRQTPPKWTRFITAFRYCTISLRAVDCSVPPRLAFTVML